MENLSQIREVLNQILNKLETTELKIEKQADEINKYIQKHCVDSESSDLLTAQGKSTKTSIELLREEIEELHQVVKVIFQEISSDKDTGSVETPTLQSDLENEDKNSSNLTEEEGNDGLEE